MRLVESNFYLEERAARKEQKARDELKSARRARFDVLVGVLRSSNPLYYLVSMY